MESPRLSSSPLQLWAADGMARIGRADPVGETRAVHLHAARNEWEPFQVVVSARGDDLTGVKAAISPFHGSGDAVITTTFLYREHYVLVSTSSPFSPYPPGEYPDALIPFTDPYTGAPLDGSLYDAVPFDLTDGKNQSLWVDVYVPDTAVPGTYTATFTVTADGGFTATLPVTLTVWAFTLPPSPSLRFSFWTSEAQVAAAYGLDMSDDGETFFPLMRRYYDALLDHRLMPDIPVDTYPDFDPATGELDFAVAYPGLGTAEENLAYYLNERGVQAYQLPLWEDWPYGDPLSDDREAAMDYVAAYGEYFAAHGWADRLYAYILDEPNDAEAYQLAREWGAFFDEVKARHDVSVPFLLTEQPVPDDPTWGSLIGFVDIWVPCCYSVWLDEDYYATHVISQRLAVGEEVWWYTALAQTCDEWMEEHGWPDTIAEDYAPIWLLDYPPLNYRLPAWLNAHYGFTGLLYWATVYWDETDDPWTNPATFVHWGETYNGEGMLFYPGRADEVGFDGPVVSMRLKWLREGVEDYEYIQLLRNLGEEEFALEQVHAVARNMGDWEPDPAVLYAARQAMGERLHALSRERASHFQDIGGPADFDTGAPIHFDHEISFGGNGWPFYWYTDEEWTNTDFTWYERADEFRWCTTPPDPQNWVTSRAIKYRHHGRFRVDAAPFSSADDLYLTIRYKDNLRPGSYPGAPVYSWNGSWVLLGFLGGQDDHRWKTQQFAVHAADRSVVEGHYVFKIGDDLYTDSLIGELPIDKIKLSASPDTPEFEADAPGLWPEMAPSQFDDLGRDFEYTPGEGPLFPFGILTNLFITHGGSATQPGHGAKDTWQILQDHHMNVYGFLGWEQAWYSGWAEYPNELPWDDPGVYVEPGLNEHLIQAAGHGLKVFPNFYTDTRMWWIQRSYGNSEAVLDYLEQVVRDHANNPTLGGWYIIDEWDHEDPTYGKPHEFVQQLAARTRSADPYSPILILSMGFMGPTSWEMTAESSDLVMVDVYPAQNYIQELALQGRRLDEIRSALGNDAAYILVGLGYNYEEGELIPIEGEARPYTPQEILAQAYMGLTHGSKGVIFWCGNVCHPDFHGPGWPASYSQQVWQGLRQMGEELFGDEGLVDALLPPGGLLEVMGESGLVSCSNSVIHHALYRTGTGERVLIALNPTRSEQTATFTVADLGTCAIITLRFEEGRTILSRGGTFDDTFQPLEHHVYVLPSPLCTCLYLPLTLRNTP